MPSLAELRPELRPYAEYLLQIAAANHLRPQVNSVYRSPAQQAVLYERSLACQRSGGSCLPAAPPGRSMHELRLAFDISLLGGYREPHQRRALEALGRVWKSWGGRWHPSDPVHFSV